MHDLLNFLGAGHHAHAERDSRPPRRLSLIRLMVAPVVIGLLLAGTLVGIDRLAFRDVGHFYTPLYDYVAWRCQTQWLPLWNPLDQTGLPLIGETSTAVLYPVRYAMFALPISSNVAMAWYIGLHLVLASATATIAARWMGARWPAAPIAGLVYSLSGSVLFLSTNPPFLVSAAWLPIVIGLMIGRPRWKTAIRVVIAAVAMAMMILGGDPQTTLHAWLVAIAVVGCRSLKNPRSGIRQNSQSQHPRSGIRQNSLRQHPRSGIRQNSQNQRLPTNPAALEKGIGSVARRQAVAAGWTTVLIAPLLAALLAAPQLAASISWSSQSERRSPERETSWLAPPIKGGKRHQAFTYSFPPWHGLELFTPNASGSLLPIYRRVTALIPGDGRVWTPTIYMSMLAVVALANRLLSIRNRGIDAPLAIATISLALACGHFGIVWWIQATTGAMSQIDSSVGGPYWWLYRLLPGYDAFRYPAKWLPIFALAASVITAKSVQRRTFAGRPAFVLVAGVLVCGLIATLLVPPPETILRDEFWGPLRFDEGIREIRVSLVHSFVVLSMIAAVTWFARTRRWSTGSLAFGLLMITAIDVGLAGRQLIHRVRIIDEQVLARHIQGDSFVEPSGLQPHRSMRSRAGDGWPKGWSATSSADRLLEVEASMRAASFGRWHLSDRTAMFNNMVSIRSRAMAEFWAEAREATADLSTDERDDFWQRQRQRLSIDRIVHTTQRTRRVDLGGSVFDVADIHIVKPTNSNLSRPIASSLASSELSRPIAPSIASQAEASLDRRSDPATLPTTIVRPVYQDGNWRAAYRIGEQNADWTRIKVESHDGLLQSVRLPVGATQLRFEYAPWWLTGSITIATISWAATLLLTVAQFVEP